MTPVLPQSIEPRVPHLSQILTMRTPHYPPDVFPRQVTLRDRVTVATIVPFASQNQVPPSLLAYLSDQFRKRDRIG
ncbi:hypothetical protein EYC84_008999 [Monilinia fructicola]|uniref:Uncharacterized protein n=1 Tax=Monilinia fructicola TaxID=38448 RepID=A0A5M9JFF6_MONFR|nr:hypothetical protein EYC84_008999 [Monilinia fructicola]